MLTPSLNTVMTRLLIVAAVLGTLVFFAPAIFAQDADTIQYSENGTDAVRTFVSEDPEGAGIDWDVTGLDADDFYIDSRGMLMFNSSPNFEAPTDREWDADSNDTTDDGEGARNNLYQITVRATERDGTTNRALSTEQHFTVQVMNEDEDGSITLNWLQPEVGTPIEATLSDSDMLTDPDTPTDDLIDGDDQGDPDAVMWQWSYSKVTNPQIDVEGHWTNAAGLEEGNALPGALTSSYIPLGDCEEDKGGTPDFGENQGCNGGTAADATARDEGKYLRVKATYTDRKGTGKIAYGMSANQVRAEVSSDLDNVENPENGSPGFTQGLDYTRSVPESTAGGMPVGAAVVAIDPNDDTLTYGLVAVAAPNDGDVGYFSIDKATGQISIKSGMKLDYDANPSENSPDGKYVFTVMATDPSGESAMVEVTVTATAANDAPEIMGSLRREGYVANEDENRAPDFGTPGAPAELTVREKDDDNDSYTGFPQMPLPGNTVADDGMDGDQEPGLGAPNVFTAGDEDARGQIFWTLRGDDADDFVITSTGLILTGFRGPDEPTALRFASAPDYENPTDANMDSVYEVTIVATDSSGAEDSHDVTVFVKNVNEAGEAALSVEQPTIGQPITASVSDPDNNVTIVTWQWSRSDTKDGTYTPIRGATTETYVPWADDKPDTEDDNSMFLRATATYMDTTSDMDLSGTGLVDERVQAKATEGDPDATAAPTAKTAAITDTGDSESNLYRVTVTSDNAVRVSDESTEATPVFGEAPYVREVAENSEHGTIVGLPVAASYSGSLDYSITNADANDNKYFAIDEGNGQIRVASMDVPDPTPSDQIAAPTTATPVAEVTDPTLDFEGKQSFTLVITATDSGDPGRKASATVTVNLTDLNEAPYFDKVSREKVETVDDGTGVATTQAITYAENRRTAVVALAAIEPDGDALRWELTGADAGAFEVKDIPDGSGTRDRVELVFKDQPNFESRGGVDNPYNVTVRATEEMDSVSSGPAKATTLNVMVQVTDIDEGGKVSINWLQPEVGTLITATASDPDGIDNRRLLTSGIGRRSRPRTTALT